MYQKQNVSKLIFVENQFYLSTISRPRPVGIHQRKSRCNFLTCCDNFVRIAPVNETGTGKDLAGRLHLKQHRRSMSLQKQVSVGFRALQTSIDNSSTVIFILPHLVR